MKYVLWMRNQIPMSVDELAREMNRTTVEYVTASKPSLSGVSTQCQPDVRPNSPSDFAPSWNSSAFSPHGDIKSCDIPMRGSNSEDCSTRRKDHVTRKKRQKANQMNGRYLRDIMRVTGDISRMLKDIDEVISLFSASMEELMIVLGSTIFTPKEMYSIASPMQTSWQQAAEVRGCVLRQLFRHLVTSEELNKVFSKPLTRTNMYIMLKLNEVLHEKAGNAGLISRPHFSKEAQMKKKRVHHVELSLQRRASVCVCVIGKTVSLDIRPLLPEKSRSKRSPVMDEGDGSGTSGREDAPYLLYDILIPIVTSLIIVLNGGVLVSTAKITLRGLIVGSIMASAFSVVMVSADRLISIVCPLTYSQHMNGRRAGVCIGVIWLLAFVFGFLPALGWREPGVATHCIYVLIATRSCLIFVTVMGILVPFSTIAIIYAVVLVRACKKRRVKSKFRRRAFLVVLAIVGAFFVTWMPYFLATLVYAACGREGCKSVVSALATVLPVLGQVNSLLNPVIYAWWHKGFRDFVKNRTGTCCERAKRRVLPSKPTQEFSLPVRARGSSSSLSKGSSQETHL
ncbi:unnamed protein product [Darwinula stevensoni]|uniref:G-protein coupled receptors family 1 profile domain-containing protein n=1 Tax=Darwinula stevensoni TaxID=69355 RepID=A0A7R9AB61_9CRUS|nr:unnamed protein product [Darwinula stevensoni]CAG0898630.1 unnamed protein product [Darwinula stevensoni]